MFELIIMLTRYLFVFYILYFLWQTFVYIMYEKGQTLGMFSMTKQRGIIIFFHVTSFLILAYEPDKYTFDWNVLLIAVAFLFFFIYANITSDWLYKKSCPLLWNCMFFLFDISLVMLQRLNPPLAQRQLIWIFIGFSVMLFIPIIFKLFYRFYRLEYLYLIPSLILLLSPFLFGVSEYGATNWISIANIKFQPSELVKFLYIFYLASIFRVEPTLKKVILPTAIAVVFVLILVLQRDLGGALIFFMTFMTMFYIATGNWILLAVGIFSASSASFLAYKIFYHIRVRVEAWSNPWKDIDKGGYQIVQSLFAISTWGLSGSGLTRGYPKTIPVVERDFIFAAICEEFGSLFGICLIAVFVTVFLRGMIIALRCNLRFYAIIASGITSMLAFQTFLIIGGVTKLIPLTGVTLPFISYGGTSVVISILMIGILQWISAERNEIFEDY